MGQEQRNDIYDMQQAVTNEGLHDILKKVQRNEKEEDGNIEQEFEIKKKEKDINEERDIQGEIEKMANEISQIANDIQYNYDNNNNNNITQQHDIINNQYPSNSPRFQPNETFTEPLIFNRFIHNNDLGQPEKISYDNVDSYTQQLTYSFNNHNHHNKSFFNTKPYTIPETEPVKTSEDFYNFDNTFAPYHDEIVYPKNYDTQDLLKIIIAHKQEVKGLFDIQSNIIAGLKKEVADLKNEVNRGQYLHNQDLYELKQTKTNKIRKNPPATKKSDLPLPTTGKPQPKQFIIEQFDISKIIKKPTSISPKPMIHQKMEINQQKKGTKRMLEPTSYDSNSKKKAKINH